MSRKSSKVVLALGLAGLLAEFAVSQPGVKGSKVNMPPAYSAEAVSAPGSQKEHEWFASARQRSGACRSIGNCVQSRSNPNFKIAI